MPSRIASDIFPIGRPKILATWKQMCVYGPIKKNHVGAILRRVFVTQEGGCIINPILRGPWSSLNCKQELFGRISVRADTQVHSNAFGVS